jgi:hypothetical protein
VKRQAAPERVPAMLSLIPSHTLFLPSAGGAGLSPCIFLLLSFLFIYILFCYLFIALRSSSQARGTHTRAHMWWRNMRDGGYAHKRVAHLSIFVIPFFISFSSLYFFNITINIIIVTLNI